MFSKSKITVNAKPYTGKEVEIGKDDIKVMYKGTELIYKKDYDIIKDSYKNNIKKGKATVTIKGCGEYVGEKTVTFTIKPMGAK